MTTPHLHKPEKQLNGFSLYHSNDIAIIVIDRGENRLNKEFVTSFNILLDDVEKNDTCKGLITTGAGKFYGNGLDLEWMATLQQDDLLIFFYSLSSLLKRILYFPLPTLAALNGHAYAGGALLAFAHDLRTMRIDRGWLCFNEVFINRIFSDFFFAYLRDKIGHGKNLSEAIVLGRRYTAEDAFQCGLISAMPSENLLLSESIRVLKSFYGKTGFPRDSLVRMKEATYRNALDIYNLEKSKQASASSKL
ncbi:unnamed protein product [Lymnaea stagnalis]|uniref:Uncharacterized protein n=1 Tax=Lymnaea stagnalis TaxID=6523 RepID=A0AAV2I987_LYMST